MATETGSVNQSREPIIPIRLSEALSIDCVVDTGFSGALMLPQRIVESLGVPIIGKETFQLVFGNSIVASLALVEIGWLGQQRLVRVIVSKGSDALIGAELLDRNRLVIDYMIDRVTLMTNGADK